MTNEISAEDAIKFLEVAKHEAKAQMTALEADSTEGRFMFDCFDKAIAALRSPAPGAVAMREALLDVARAAQEDAFDVASRHYGSRYRLTVDLDRLDRIVDSVPLPAREVPDQMAAFGAAAWGLLKTRYGAAEMCEGDEAFIELALKAGLCTRQPYDREQHGYVEDADEGDMIYVWGNR